MEQQQNFYQDFVQGIRNQEDNRCQAIRTREAIRDLIRQTQNCDGSSTLAVRTWIREVTLAFNQVGHTSIIEIAAKTVSGPFRFELERYIETQINTHNIGRSAFPWADLRDHLATQFLNVDESAALKDDLDRIQQSAFEPTQQYVRRFREVADTAYPINQRNIDQERLLIKTFAKGLSSDTIALKLVDGEPPNLEAAITVVSQACSREDAYARLRRDTRNSIPMEIASDTDIPTNTTRTVESLSSTMEHLATKIAKLEARDNRMASDKTARRVPGPAPPRSSANRPPRDYYEQRPSYDRYPAERRPPPDRRPPADRQQAGRQHNTARRADFRPSFSTGPQPRRQLQCYCCGEQGHFAADCPMRTRGYQHQHRQGNEKTSWR